MEAGPQVLVVDDDPQLREALTRALELDDYRVSTASNGVKALESVTAHRPDVMILDVMMPYVGGLDVCRTLRSRKDKLPILVLTARDEVGDRVAGLDAGADDYLTKPFALEELRARLRALLRRTTPEEGDDTAILEYEDMVLAPAAHTVHRGERSIDLTRTEFALLELLLRNAGRPLPRETIMDRVWGWESEPTSNSLEVFVGYLRRKTEASGEARLIHTVRGVGYVLRSESCPVRSPL
jgi:two-component system, OmpR family, response regulator MprA